MFGAPSRRGLLLGAAAVSTPLPVYAAAPRPPTIEDLTRAPATGGAALSPDGTKAALLMQEPDGEKGAKAYVVVLDVTTAPRLIRRINLEMGKGNGVVWANDERLLISLVVPAIVIAGSAILVGYKSRTFSVPILGDSVIRLLEDQTPSRKRGRGLAVTAIADLTPDDPSGILMTAWDGRTLDLFRVDVNTGASVRVEKGSRETVAWQAHKGTPILRFDSRRRGEVLRIFGRAPGDSEWIRIADTPTQALTADSFNYLGPTADPAVVYVAARNGGPTMGIWRYDLRAKSFRDLMLRHDTLDMDGAVFDQVEGLIGGRYLDDRLVYDLTDRQLARHWKAVNTFFDNEANVEFEGVSRNRRRLLLRVSGPRDPGGYYLYDLDRAAVEPLATARPWLMRDQLAAVETVKVPTRDGADIRAYLTVPAGSVARPAPLVVMPHGGPEVRDQVEFDPVVQALAAQGWLVVQPQFRGGGGFGRAFAEMGHGQWAGLMQDDLSDTVEHLVRTGRVDPRRVAIMGFSYGGYAALMAAVASPARYVAAVAGSGPSDLTEMLAVIRKEDGADSPEYKLWTQRIGDPKVNGAAVAAASPRRRVGEITAPVLLLHGASDVVVPVEQSRRMAAALKAAGKLHQYEEFEGEGHDSWSVANESKMLRDAIAFLKPRLA